MFSCHVVEAGLHFLYTLWHEQKHQNSPALRSKAATIEELTRGVGKLQEFLAQVEDLGREGFPYLDAAKARTELQFRECIRRTFGEKSPEFQEHRHHRLLMDSPEDTQQSITLIKTLIATLEQKKLDLQGGPPPATNPTNAGGLHQYPRRPQMTLVPASIPTVHMTMTQRSTGHATANDHVRRHDHESRPVLSHRSTESTLRPPLAPSASSGESEPHQSPSTSLPEPFADFTSPDRDGDVGYPTATGGSARPGAPASATTNSTARAGGFVTCQQATAATRT